MPAVTRYSGSPSSPGMSLFDQAISRRLPSFAIQWPTCGLESRVDQIYASTAPNASASSGGMTKSRASRPSTSSRANPVARTHASLKKRMRPVLSRTQTSDIVVSVRTLANSSPTMNSAVSGIDVEERDLVLLQRLPRHADRFGGELAEPVSGLGARAEGVLVGPERDHERLRALAIGEPEQAAEPGAIPQPRQQLVADDLQAPFVLLGCGLQDVQTGEHPVLLHCVHELRAASCDRLGDQPRGPLGCECALGRRADPWVGGVPDRFGRAG